MNAQSTGAWSTDPSSGPTSTVVGESPPTPAPSPSPSAVGAGDPLEALSKLKAGEELEFEGTRFRLNALGVGPGRITSVGGRFSIEAPIPVNDLRVGFAGKDGNPATLHILGGKTRGLLSWSAMCTSPDATAPRPDEAKVQAEVPSDVTEIHGSKAVSRTIKWTGRVCTAIVEAQGTDPLPSPPEVDRFLKSFSPSP